MFFVVFLLTFSMVFDVLSVADVSTVFWCISSVLRSVCVSFLVILLCLQAKTSLVLSPIEGETKRNCLSPMEAKIVNFRLL